MAAQKTFILKGIASSPGLAFGKARVVYSWEQTVGERILDRTKIAGEIIRLDDAVNNTLLEINRLKKMAGEKVGGPAARIFDTQLMIVSDQAFLKKVKDQIRTTRRNAEFVYRMLVEESVIPLRNSKDAYMNQMVYEIEAVSKRVVNQLRGHSEVIDGAFPRDTIILGQNFTAAEVLNLFDRKVRAIVAAEGNSTSHMALIARSLLLPTIVAIPNALTKVKTGDRIIVDGDKGELTVHPSDSVWNSLVKRKASLKALPLTRLKKLPDFPPKTRDNVEINLAANVNLPGPADRILPKHNVGVGLYRTEFMYLQRGTFPSEDDQFELYDHVAGTYHPQTVVIRTFDLGSDKYHPNDNFGQEKNPALGWRGIRSALDMPKLFRSQIRAILRASHRHNVHILLPMITDISEVRKAVNIIKRTMAVLDKEKFSYDRKIKIGIMIEVPSAALNAELLAEKVDFFSIGSNDLTQYTLAVDRDNKKLSRAFNPLHPSVLRLYKFCVDAARVHGIPVNVCGEISGDILAIPLLIGMGMSQLSMNPAKLHGACNLISRISLEDARRLADKILSIKTIKEVEKELLEFNVSI